MSPRRIEWQALLELVVTIAWIRWIFWLADDITMVDESVNTKGGSPEKGMYFDLIVADAVEPSLSLPVGNIFRSGADCDVLLHTTGHQHRSYEIYAILGVLEFIWDFDFPCIFCS